MSELHGFVVDLHRQRARTILMFNVMLVVLLIAGLIVSAICHAHHDERGRWADYALSCLFFLSLASLTAGEIVENKRVDELIDGFKRRL